MSFIWASSNHFWRTVCGDETMRVRLKFLKNYVFAEIRNSFGRCVPRRFDATIESWKYFSQANFCSTICFDWIITIIVWRFNHKQTFMAFVDLFCSPSHNAPVNRKLVLNEKMRVPKTFEQRARKLEGVEALQTKKTFLLLRQSIEKWFYIYAHVLLLAAVV